MTLEPLSQVSLDDEAIQLLFDRGTFWCPTLTVYSIEDMPTSDALRRKIVERHKATFQEAMQKGVKIVFDTAVGVFEHGLSAREFELMMRYGMKPLEAIRSTTSRAAELLPMDKEDGPDYFLEAGLNPHVFRSSRNSEAGETLVTSR